MNSMVNINWYPGHMSKALKEMEKEVSAVDCVIYVLDARAPFSCLNPKFTKIIGDKPIIYVLNKSDLGNDTILKEWVKYFTSEKSNCIMLNSTASGMGKKIETCVKELCIDKINKFVNKGINIILRAMILGVPNSGKSTLANNLCGKARALTGNKPGVTKSKQWIKLSSNIELLDTPGTLWPVFNNNAVACHLAFIGSISDNVLDISELAVALSEDIYNLDKNILINRYDISIDDDCSGLSIIESICKNRRYLVKGGDYDYERCAKAFINEFRDGKLGKITLEKVSDIKNLSKKDRKQNDD